MNKTTGKQMFHDSIQYYDLIYSAMGKDYQQESRQLHRLIRQYKRSKGKWLLDVACGTGSHLKYLQNHYQVEGLDLNQKFLKLARQKLPGIPLHQGNMADFDLNKRYDVITCLFSSIGYVQTYPQLVRVIQNMKHHLKPGGLIIIEPWLFPEDYKIRTPYAATVDQPDLKIARLNTSTRRGNLSIIVFHYLIANPQGVKYFSEKHSLRLFTHEQYLKTFHTCKLQMVFNPLGLTGRSLYIGIYPL
jgi:ubiquinone/menaquinone biosynthesis C-methylase UbiE